MNERTSAVTHRITKSNTIYDEKPDRILCERQEKTRIFPWGWPTAPEGCVGPGREERYVCGNRDIVSSSASHSILMKRANFIREKNERSSVSSSPFLAEYHTTENLADSLRPPKLSAKTTVDHPLVDWENREKKLSYFGR